MTDRGSDRESEGNGDASLQEGPGAAKVLQKRQLIARIAQRTGQKNAQVKPIVEATLAELGMAISAGHTLALPPLGRARISRQKDVSGSDVIVLRLRRRRENDAGEVEEE